jgi:hypothetical protein
MTNFFTSKLRFAIAFLLLLFTVHFSLLAQNVGIGITTPLEKLHVAGNVRVDPLAGVGNRMVGANATGTLIVIAAGTTGQVLTQTAGGPAWSNASNDWAILGNAGTNPATNFLGTTDNQALVFRTNNVEDARISTNGNVSIGTTASTTARLHNYLPATDAATTTGLYNEHEGAATGTIYGIRNYNNSSTNSTKYGLYNYTNGTGTGGRYGIYNYVLMDPTTTGTGYGTRNFINGEGTGTIYGTYNYLLQSGTGTTYGIYNLHNLNPASTSLAYGLYTDMDYSSGTRIGAYKELNSNATYDGDVYGDQNDFRGTGDGISVGNFNNFEVSGTGSKTGIWNLFNDIQGTKYGTFQTFAAGTNTGTIYGHYTEILNNSASTRYGVYNYLSGGTGAMRGTYNALYPDAAATGTAYGVYSLVADNGTGTHYGGYFSAYGAGNYSVYATNTEATGYSGYFYGNLLFRSAGRTYGMYGDYTNDVVRFGTNNGALTSNGAVLAGTTVDYVADFDKGTVDGTAIGIGSIEFLLDGNARTTINNELDPAAHIIYDLGESTTAEAWDDVFADDFWNVSDIREKENVQPMNYGLAEVMGMRTISYKLKSDPFKDPKIGLVAQEVVNLVPEAVKTHDHKITDESRPTTFERVELERMGMNYGTLVPVLIKAVQEQQAQIDALKAEIQELKGK